MSPIKGRHCTEWLAQTPSHPLFLCLLTRETAKLNLWPPGVLAASDDRVTQLKVMKYKHRPRAKDKMPHFLNRKEKPPQEKACAATPGPFPLFPGGTQQWRLHMKKLHCETGRSVRKASMLRDGEAERCKGGIMASWQPWSAYLGCCKRQKPPLVQPPMKLLTIYSPMSPTYSIGETSWERVIRLLQV